MAKAKRRKKPTDKVLEETVDEMTDQEVDTLVKEMEEKEPQVIEAGMPRASVKAGPQSKDQNRLVSIRIPVHIKLNRQEMQPGVHKVPFHQVATIMEMVNKKQKADLSIFVGKNYFVQKLLDRSLVVREVEDLNLKTLSK